MELTRNQNGGINMLYKYFTEKLTGLQGLSIEKVEENQKTLFTYIANLSVRNTNVLAVAN